MRQSKLFTKTLKEISSSEESINAQLLTRGGFIYKNSAGVYSYLPLGWRVIENIKKIIREEMNAIEGVEVFLPALVEKKYLDATNRFNLDVGFDVIGKKDKNPKFALGWTHEEVLTAIVSKYVSSYRDLPFYVYQIQTKFRNEVRVKSGLLRGREFLMKDLYSFHTSEKDLFNYYEKVKNAYFKIFERCNLEAIYTLAPGGDFTIKNTHEFQVISETGEDSIIYCAKCKYAENLEMITAKTMEKCPECKGEMTKVHSIEVGNIFPLGTKYSEAFGLRFKDEKGKSSAVAMGSYGIGISRLMGTIVEMNYDEKGIIWPKGVSPYSLHLVALDDSEDVQVQGEEIYKNLVDAGIEVLYDDRSEISAGRKFADTDLIGIPIRALVSENSLKMGGVEIKHRNSEKVEVIDINLLIKKITND